MIHHYGDKVKIWAPIEHIEASALQQIGIAARHPLLFQHLAVMPDVHTGIGCTIGSVIPIKDAVIPAAVGVDIGCGCCAIKSTIQLDELSPHFEKLFTSISQNIPTGFSHRQDRQMVVCHEFLEQTDIEEKLKEFQEQYPGKDILPQLGTLGGGNHFIELQVDEEGYIWIMIHSGSRNIGHKIATEAIDTAITLWRTCATDQSTPKDMEYLPENSEEGQKYIFDMTFALMFAKMNRLLMMKIIMGAIQYEVPECRFGDMINIHHNYAAKEEHFGEEVWVHRKGATKAVSSALGIIPGSMGTSSFIVRGKDCANSFNSCSHGAGRTMSRTAARGRYHRKTKSFKTEGRLNVADFEKDMQGIFTHDVDRNHLDEAPRAYKDIRDVMANQTDLIDIVEELQPVFNIKG